MAKYRLLQKRLDRALLVAALLLCALLLLIPGRETPYTETTLIKHREEIPEELNAFLKLSSTNINTADRDELIALPGIGEILADRILQYRAEHGPFEDWSEFCQIQGIGEHTVESLRPVAYLGV